LQKTNAIDAISCAQIIDDPPLDRISSVCFDRSNTREEEIMRGWAVVRNGAPLEAVEVTTPEPTGAQVLLKTTYCGVCHSDLYFQDGYYDLGGGKRLSLKDRGVTLPFIPGHETVGKVVALGPEAKGVAIGDHRLVYPWAGCGKCKHCLSGNDHMCLTPRSLGVFRDGGYGSHVLVDKPEHLIDFGNVDPALAATYACSGITAYSAVRKLSDVEPDSPVVVIGAGGLGLAAISILVALGYQRIVAVDVSDEKLGVAREAGAHAGVNAKSGELADELVKAAGKPIYGVVDFVASSDTAKAGVAVLARGGTYVPVGLYGGDLTLPLPTIPLRAITIRGSYTGSQHELRELVDLARSGKLRAVPVERVTHDDPNPALDRVRSGAVTGRLVLDASLHAAGGGRTSP
jgi:alcohol dehydrogenase, propanol-preferring